MLFSFTCFGQSESTTIPSPAVFDLENANLEEIAKSKAYHKYVFEVENFKAFDAQNFLYKITTTTKYNYKLIILTFNKSFSL